jgi:hypothetical protein
MALSRLKDQFGSLLRTGLFAATTVAAAAVTTVPASALTVYDTTYAWDGSSFIYPFGSSNTATYGQTFIAPVTDNVLQSFTFYLNGDATLQFQAEVYAWSGSLAGGNGPQGAVGAPLYTSAPIVLGPTGGAFVPVTIVTGGTTLIPGNAYVALFTISGPDPTNYTNSTGTDVWGNIPFTHVPGGGGGGFAFFNNGDNYSIINNGNWDNFDDFGDSAWTAVFTSVPEPGTLALLGAALVGFGVIRRRRAAS